MPSPREQLVRDAVGTFDRAGPDEILSYLAEDVVWREDPAWPAGSTWHGHDGVREALGVLLDSIDFDSGELISHVEFFFDLGGAQKALKTG